MKIVLHLKIDLSKISRLFSGSIKINGYTSSTDLTEKSLMDYKSQDNVKFVHSIGPYYKDVILYDNEGL